MTIREKIEAVAKSIGLDVAYIYVQDQNMTLDRQVKYPCLAIPFRSLYNPLANGSIQFETMLYIFSPMDTRQMSVAGMQPCVDLAVAKMMEFDKALRDSNYFNKSEIVSITPQGSEFTCKEAGATANLTLTAYECN